MSECFQLTDNALFQKVADEAVILDSETGNYYTLDAIGTFIIDRVQKKQSLKDIILEICSEYEVDSKTAQGDTVELLDELKKEGLLECL